jgi:hypothetical protein
LFFHVIEPTIASRVGFVILVALISFCFVAGVLCLLWFLQSSFLLFSSILNEGGKLLEKFRPSQFRNFVLGKNYLAFSNTSGGGVHGSFGGGRFHGSGCFDVGCLLEL